MADITAALVKELRELTGAGMMDCKKALANVEGDIEKAIDFLREKGLAGAQKKAGRIAAEGVCDTLISEDGKSAVVVEVNAETDFVAKNDKFKNYVKEVASQALTTAESTIEGFLNQPWINDATLSVSEKLSSMISIIGENMHIRRFEKLTENDGFIESYIHGGGKIGVLLDVATNVDNAAIHEMARNICMQVAALKPIYTSSSEVDADYIAKEKEILLAQIKNDPKEASKPEKVIEGMIQGRINKELKEIVLLDQVYVKAEDGKQTVKAYVDSVAKAENANIVIKKFIRFETGEGLEKKNENFAEEVAKQMQG